MRARATLIGYSVIALLLFRTTPSAQAIPAQSIEDKVLGWMKIYDVKIAGTMKPITVDQRVFSSAQLGIGQLFTHWMQASYLPKGALGDVLLTHNDKLTANNQNTAALPQSYGASAKLYTELKYGVNKKIEPLTSSALFWTLEANGFYGIAADAVSTPEHYYFTLPTFAQQVFTNNDGVDLEKAAAVSGHPFLKQFPTFFMRNSVSGNRRYVLLSKDRRLPFVTITKGQYLDALDTAIGRKRSSELKRITEAEQGDQKRIAVAMADVDARTARRMAALASNREKYKNRLQETAEIWTDQPDVMLENAPDVFERSGSPMRLPVYTIDPKVAELCKTDAPQWIVMSWTAHLNDPVNLSLHQAILNNVNFQYIYDYFFDPAKVKGQPYTPLKPVSAVETPASVTPPAATPSAAAAKSVVDPAVVFFEDFSSGTVGTKPLNWRSTLDATGTSSVVTELKGVDGRWASMGGMLLTPPPLKTPIPVDFEVSYDMVAAQNYRWGARGLTFKLSRTAGSASYLSLRIRPGFGGREGEAVIEAAFPGSQEYLSGTKYAAAPGFSNDAAINRITVTIKKKGELLEVFIGKNKIAEYAKGVPAGLQFDAFTFDLSGGTTEDKMFISNIRIAKN